MLSEDYRSNIMTVIDRGTGSDPILQAQTIPINFWVEPSQEGALIKVRLTFGPQTTRYYDLHLVQDPPLYWLIDNITIEPISVFDPQAYLGINTQKCEEFKSEDH